MVTDNNSGPHVPSKAFQLLLSKGLKDFAEGNASQLLDDREAVWWLSEGHVNVFSCRLVDGVPAGRLIPCFGIGEGDIALGVDPVQTGPGQGLVAKAETRVRFERIPRDALLRLVPEDPTAVRCLSGWIRALCGTLTGGTVPDGSKPVLSAERHKLEPGDRIAGPNEVCFVRLDEGEGSFCGRTNLQVTPAEGWVPLAPGTWIAAETGCAVRVRALAGTFAADDTAEVLDTMHRFVLRALEQAAALEEQQSRAEVVADEAHLQETFRESIEDLSRSLSQRRKLSAGMGTPQDGLLAACDIIGEQIGVRFGRRGQKSPQDEQGWSLDAICQRAGVQGRPVTLEGNWWSQDSGPLLGFLEESNEPVALIPRARGSYSMVRPSTGEKTNLTGESASCISPHGFMLYPTLGEGKATGRTVLSTALRGSLRDILRVFAVGFLGGLLSLLFPLMTQYVIDTVIPQARGESLVLVASVLFLGTIMTSLLAVVRTFALLRVEGRSSNTLQSAIWGRVLTLPMEFFRRYTAGDLSNRISGIDQIRRKLSVAILSNVFQAVFSLTNLVLMIYYSVELALVGFLLVLLNSVVVSAVSSAQLKRQRAAKDLQGKLSGKVFQFLSHVEKLHATHSEARAFHQWSKTYSAMMAKLYQSGLLATIASTFSSLYPVLCPFCIFLVYAYAMTPGTMSTGSFLAFLGAFAQLTAGFLPLNQSIETFVEVKPLYERAKPILQREPETSDGQVEVDNLAGRIELRHVSFRYAENTPRVIKNVSLSIEPGDYVAIVGPSGAGKSTVLQLLLGFVRPETGGIFFDDQDMSDLNLRLLRKQFSVVLQHSELFAGSVYDNIAGASDVTMDDVWDAAKAISLDEEIKRLPMGMFTYVAEKGRHVFGWAEATTPHSARHREQGPDPVL